MRAVQITEFGGPEVLRVTDVEEPDVPAGATLLSVTGAGVNFADTHAVDNTYLSRVRLPYIPGLEVVGTTPEGRRVVALVSGGYAERAVVWPQLSFEVPDAVDDNAALAIVLQGTTAWHLLRTSGRLQRGETVLVHAAAGGVGTIAVQLAKAWGAGRVIAAASTETKRELAKRLGADATIDSTGEGLREAILEANHGQGVDIALEMTGGATFDATLSSLADDGRIVVYGQAGRVPATPVAPHTLDGEEPRRARRVADHNRQASRTDSHRRRRAAGDGSSRPARDGARERLLTRRGTTGSRGPAGATNGRQARARPRRKGRLLSRYEPSRPSHPDVSQVHR